MTRDQPEQMGRTQKKEQQRSGQVGSRSDTIKCRSCDQTFQSQEDLRNHERQAHREQSRS